jgi:hypothetical protein
MAVPLVWLAQTSESNFYSYKIFAHLPDPCFPSLTSLIPDCPLLFPFKFQSFPIYSCAVLVSVRCWVTFVSISPALFLTLKTTFTIVITKVYTSTQATKSKMYFSKVAAILSLATSALALPTAEMAVEKRDLTFRKYADFQISNGTAGNALAEAQAAFPVSLHHAQKGRIRFSYAGL